MADSKSTADVLLELIYSWIEQRELCAQQLRKLAQELEALRQKCNASEIIGSSVSVVGGIALIGAGVATLLTGGAAAPLMGLAGAVYTGVGATISVVTKITEHFLSSSTLEEAQKIDKKSDEIADKIQRLFQQLREEIMKTTSLTDEDEDEDEDEVDRHVMNRILGAMARQSSQHMLTDFSNNDDLNAIIGRMSQVRFGAGASQLSNVSGKLATAAATGTAVFAISALFTLEAGKNMKPFAKKGTDQLIKVVSSAGFKTAVKGGTMVVGGAVGLGFALDEAIDSWKEMIKNNHVTKASQSLRETADAIMNMTQTLREQLDTMRQTLRVFAEMLRCIEDSDRSSEEKRKMRPFVLKMLEHTDFMEWLGEHSDPESIKSRCQTSLKLTDRFDLLKQALDEEKEKIVNKDDIHITFVAHGAIEQEMIPANTLLPSSTIKDVVVYSPWNCAINADVAYGIATGITGPQHRVFRCKNKPCQIPDEGHRPTSLPNHWNSMKKAAAERWMIPNILVSPLRKPKDGAWERFKFLQDEHGRPGINRIVIPFILPDEHEDDVSHVPFSVVITTLSEVLESSSYRATVHLAACLGKISAGTNLHEGYLKEQYACTIDNTKMKSDKMLINRGSKLYRALYDLFG